MAVDRSTSPDPAPTAPVRTCIGCRQRASAAELLRTVVATDSAPGETAVQSARVVPDPRRREPGRGAWVHPTTACVELAQRRRAFSRALRVSGPSDPAAVSEYVRGGNMTDRPAEPTAGDDEQ